MYIYVCMYVYEIRPVSPLLDSKYGGIRKWGHYLNIKKYVFY